MTLLNCRYQTFVTVSGNLGGKVPLVDDVLFSQEQKDCAITSIDENCMEFEFQTDWHYYVDLRKSYLASKLNHIKSFGYENYNSNGF